MGRVRCSVGNDVTERRTPHEGQRRISTIDLGPLEVRLAVSGAGAPLLFLNGSGPGATIEAVAPVLDRLSEKFEVACHDQRGLGQSGVPDGSWSMADYASDAFLVADHLGWEIFNVVGVSFGGMVALEMAATRPERLARLVVWGATPGGTVPSYPLHDLTSLPPEESGRILRRLLDNRLDDEPETTTPAATRSTRLRGKLAAARRRLKRRRPSTSSLDARRRGFAAQIEARRHHDVQGRLRNVRCPTFAAAGAFDDLAPAVNVAALCSEIPHASFRLYPAGHFFFTTKEALDDTVEFLSI